MVWPFWYFPKAERLVFSFRQGPRVDGMVIATPDLWGDWRRGEATYLLGGIYANLLTGLIARAAVATNIFGPLAEAILMSFFVVSMVFAVVNLMPVWFADRRRSDGARLVDKWRVRQERQTEHTGWLSAMQADGISPEDWNADLVGKVEADVAAGRADNQAYGLLYQRYMEFSDFPRARALINRRASLPGDAPDWLRVAQSFFIAYLDKNGTEAERLLNGVRSKSRASYFYWRAWAATRVARGDRRGALAAVRRARSFGNRNLVGMYRGEATILDEIERTAQALAADPPKRWIRIRWPGRPERL
jgi:hypothetical protein